MENPPARVGIGAYTPYAREKDLEDLADKLRRTGKPDACQLADKLLAEIDECRTLRAEVASPQESLLRPQRSLLPVEQKTLRRLAPKITKKGKHMLWSGAIQHDGAGKPQPVCIYEGRRTTVRRVLYDLMIAPVDSGNHVQSTCDEPFCVSPYCTRLVLGRQGYRQDRRRDAQGRALCRRGLHPLPKEPVPGRTPYCPTCYQDAKHAVNIQYAADRIEEQNARRRIPQAIEPFTILPDPDEINTALPDSGTLAGQNAPAMSDAERAEILRKGFEDIQAMFKPKPE